MLFRGVREGRKEWWGSLKERGRGLVDCGGGGGGLICSAVRRRRAQLPFKGGGKEGDKMVGRGAEEEGKVKGKRESERDVRMKEEETGGGGVKQQRRVVWERKWGRRADGCAWRLCWC